MKEYDLVAVIHGVHPTPPLPTLQMVCQAGMTAVLTSAPRSVLRLPQTQRQTLIDSATRLSWQEACLPMGTLLPARQNSPLSLSGASDFLTANQPTLSRLLQRFHGLVQVQVTVSWTEQAVLQRFRGAPELAPLFSGAAVQAAALSQAVQSLAQRISGEIGHHLTATSVDCALLPTTSDVLWNGALLVPGTQIDEFYAAVEAVDAIWSEGFRIRQIGPAPVGSFATLMLERVDPKQIQAALAAFDLASLAEIDVLDARRRDRLMTTSNVSYRRQADLVSAAARLQAVRPFAMAQIWAEGQSVELHKEVA
jgi:hypothetical protein